jgi:hypothetical protein
MFEERNIEAMDSGDVLLLMIIGTSVWVLVDAKTIGVRKSGTKAFFNMGPVGWFFACLLMWIIAFPAYIAKRPEYKRMVVAQGDELSAGPSATEPAKKGRPWLSWIVGGIAVLIGLGLIIAFSTMDALDINGLPKCDSYLAKDTAKRAFANSALNKIVNLEIISFEHVEYMVRVNADDDKTLCKAEVLTNVGKRVMFYTISKTADGNYYVYASLKPENDEAQ